MNTAELVCWNPNCTICNELDTVPFGIVVAPTNGLILTIAPVEPLGVNIKLPVNVSPVTLLTLVIEPSLTVILTPVPDVPEEPAVPFVPLEPDVPEVPFTPLVPAEPDEPVVPDEPVEPDVPFVPFVPSLLTPDVPDEPDVPVPPFAPLVPDVPDVPVPPPPPPVIVTVTAPLPLFATVAPLKVI